MAALATALRAVKHCSVAITELFTALIEELICASRLYSCCLECFDIYSETGRYGVLLGDRLSVANR